MRKPGQLRFHHLPLVHLVFSREVDEHVLVKPVVARPLVHKVVVARELVFLCSA